MKLDIYPIKICVRGRNPEKPEELTSIMTVLPEAVEDTFNNPESPPTVNIKLLIDSSVLEDLEYLHSLMWFDKFISFTGIYRLINKVNFSCVIEVSNTLELRDELKDELNHMFDHFVELFKNTVEDTQNHLILWPEDPAFSIEVSQPIKTNETEENKDEVVDNESATKTE